MHPADDIDDAVARLDDCVRARSRETLAALRHQLEEEIELLAQDAFKASETLAENGEDLPPPGTKAQ